MNQIAISASAAFIFSLEQNGGMDRDQYRSGWYIRNSLLLTVVALSVVMAVGGAATSAAATDTENVSLYVTNTADFDGGKEVEAAIEDGQVDPADELVVGETLVVAIDSERLANDLAERDGSTTERFFDTIDDGGVFFLVQTNPTTMRSAKALRIGPKNATVYRSETTTYVSIATGEVDVSWKPAQNESTISPQLRGDERFVVRFGHDEETATTSDAEVVFQVVEAQFYGSYDPLAPEVVNRSVAVHVEPEEEVIVRATLEDGSTRTDEPTPVPWSGLPGITLDFSDVEPGTAYTIELLHDAEVVDRRNGTVREPEASLRDPTATLVGDDVYAARLNLTVELSHGGVVRVLDGDGVQVGVGSVSPGNETELSIGLRYRDDSVSDFDPDELWVQALRDASTGNTPYPGTGAELQLDVEWETTNATRTSTTTATESSVSSDGDGGALPDEQYGFGIGSVFVGMVGFGYLLKRRLTRSDERYSSE
jgi:hypothetical protein